jgi:hypothetical protein
MRYMPFAIGIVERAPWLACMDQAMGAEFAGVVAMQPGSASGGQWTKS